MKKYEILKSIVLAFLTPQDQFDSLISPKDNVIIESDGSTIWIVNNKNERHESITTASAIRYWLVNNSIKEIN